MQDKFKRINRIYPLFAGLTNGLIFYVVINTVWLTNVKGFDAAGVMLLEACAGLSVRIFLSPVLKLSERIGNTWSMRLGVICLFITSILLTFGTEYWVFLLAMVFQALAVILAAMRDVIIQNNLNHFHRGKEYLRISSRAHLVYTVATMISSLLVGVFFAKWQSLPMILGTVICGICVIISFFIYDIEDRRKVHELEETAAPTNISSNKISLPHPVKFSLVVLIFCGLLYGLINLGQTDSKLLLQYQLETQFTVDQVVSYLGFAWFVSRLVRIVADLVYPKLHEKFQGRIAIILSFWALLSIALVLLGFFLKIDFKYRILLMTSGFILFPAIRDPLHIFCQTTLLSKVEKADRKNALVYLVVMQQAGKFLFSLAASLILLALPLQYIIVILAILTLPIIGLSVRLKRLLAHA